MANHRFSGEILLSGLGATEALGRALAARLAPGDLVALEGDLGAGKTTLARAILKGLGVTEAVPSPTFTLVQHYETGRIPVRHYDLYRIEDPEEIAELGLDDALVEGAALVEWPERAGTRLPSDALHVALHAQPPAEDARRVHISGPERWQVILREAAHV